MKSFLVVRSSFFVSRCGFGLLVCLLLVHPAVAEEPSTQHQEQRTKVDEPFRPEAGKFPPFEQAKAYRGELVFVDHANRRGSIRVSREELFYRNKPHPFAMLPYGMIRYHGAPADLRDIPLGTMLHGRFYLPPDPLVSSVPVVKRGTDTHPAENHAILLEGETLITVQDYTSGRVFDDAVCYAFYPVDLHTKTGVKPQPLKPGTVPTIPLRALIPKGSRNLMVAGRCVSSDRLANSGLRVQASCMGMGQAAGVAAALAAKRGTTPLEVPLGEIHDLLRSHGAIIPGDA